MAKHTKQKKLAKLTRRQAALLKKLRDGSRSEIGRPAKNLIQPGQQSSETIRLKGRELMGSLGLTDKVLTEKYLLPQLLATTTKSIRRNGKVREVTVPDYSTRNRALNMIFKLTGAYWSKDQKQDEQFGVKVIVVDMPRPPRPEGMPSVQELENADQD